MKATLIMETIEKYFNLLSSISMESVYVLDISRKRLCYVKPDDPILCGFSAEEAMSMGYNFYAKIIDPEDFPLWLKMIEVTSQYYRDSEEKRNEIDHFSCTFRLLRKYSFMSRPLQQMIYQRMKPVWLDNELRYLICTIGSSTTKRVGHLCLHRKEGIIGEEYNFTTKHWLRYKREPLTEREKAILMLAKQGKNTVEIANDLCKGECTIRNQIKSLFVKLKVHSMQEAIEFACYHHLLHSK